MLRLLGKSVMIGLRIRTCAWPNGTQLIQGLHHAHVCCNRHEHQTVESLSKYWKMLLRTSLTLELPHAFTSQLLTVSGKLVGWRLIVLFHTKINVTILIMEHWTYMYIQWKYNLEMECNLNHLPLMIIIWFRGTIVTGGHVLTCELVAVVSYCVCTKLFILVIHDTAIFRDLNSRISLATHALMHSSLLLMLSGILPFAVVARA